MATRIVSWNLGFRTGNAVRLQAQFLAELKPDLLLLQELNPRSSDIIASDSGIAWLVRSVDLRESMLTDTPVRRRGVAIGGTGPRPVDERLLENILLPERTLIALVEVEGRPTHVIAYHAPPGVNFGIDKARQAVRLVEWLSKTSGPIILGADANTPEYDMPEFKESRTHWHTGMRKLAGELGDDILFGPDNRHGMIDALRLWLAEHPEDFEQIRRLRPKGPLATSHRTGRRKDLPGIDRRFDSIWLTADFQVEAVTYCYEESLQAGSDHSAVVVDVSPAPSCSD